MTAEDEQTASVGSAGPKKRFIGKARAEALRKRVAEQSSSPNIEDGVIATRNSLPRGGRVANQIPAEILEDKALNEAIKIVFPLENYLT
jgi:2-(3-amino-3-carboxypropyl)histidine synthase